MLVLEACGKRGSSLWTTKRTNTFLERAEPSSRARRTNLRASSCIAGEDKHKDKSHEWQCFQRRYMDCFLSKMECFCCILQNNLPGPRNWHPRARTAAHRLEESCCGFWCCKMSSVTVRSPRERAALIALTRPSSSTSWQWTKVTSFLCMGRLSMLWAVLLRPTPNERFDRTTGKLQEHTLNYTFNLTRPALDTMTVRLYQTVKYRQIC